MSYTGQRAHVSKPSETPLAKGLERCPKCGLVTRPKARKTPHEDDAVCRARQIVAAYDARDWLQVNNVSDGEMIEESGAPVEWALGGYHAEDAYDDHGRQTAKNVCVQHLVGFAPRTVIQVMNVMRRTRLPPEFRRRAIKVLWKRPDLLLALDSVKRMITPVASSIHQAVRLAEEEEAAEAEAKQAASR